MHEKSHLPQSHHLFAASQWCKRFLLKILRRNKLLYPPLSLSRPGISSKVLRKDIIWIKELKGIGKIEVLRSSWKGVGFIRSFMNSLPGYQSLSLSRLEETQCLVKDSFSYQNINETLNSGFFALNQKGRLNEKVRKLLIQMRIPCCRIDEAVGIKGSQLKSKARNKKKSYLHKLYN